MVKTVILAAALAAAGAAPALAQARITLITDEGRFTITLPEHPVAASPLADGALLLHFKDRPALVFKNGRIQPLNLARF